ncbi:MAG: hypothetical protein HON04_06965 [Planctomicrobium sp.]|jgi:hypothetical protein|nr:hypothetical protein [Planctomicrobium sp.]
MPSQNRPMLVQMLFILFLTMLVVGCGDSVIESVDEVVRCRSLPGDRAARPLEAWKYELISQTASQIEFGDKGLTLPQIKKRLRQIPDENLPQEIEDFDQSVEYVILEMEVRGELSRLSELDAELASVPFTLATTVIDEA